jgi:hypothetical protein
MRIDPTEKHYSIQQVAEMWGLSEATVRRMYQLWVVLKLSGAKARLSMPAC